MPLCVSGVLVCSSFLLIRGPILPAVRQKLHLSPCSDFQSRLSRLSPKAKISAKISSECDYMHMASTVQASPIEGIIRTAIHLQVRPCGPANLSLQPE